MHFWVVFSSRVFFLWFAADVSNDLEFPFRFKNVQWIYLNTLFGNSKSNEQHKMIKSFRFGTVHTRLIISKEREGYFKWMQQQKDVSKHCLSVKMPRLPIMSNEDKSD